VKNIDLEIPSDQLVVITGLSGSGKSSLAFDTIAETRIAIAIIVAGVAGKSFGFDPLGGTRAL